jgi:hypothetical protein
MFQINAPANLKHVSKLMNQPVNHAASQPNLQNTGIRLGQPHFGKLYFGDPPPERNVPKWSDSPFFHDKRQEFYQEYYQYEPFELSTALIQEQKIFALMPQIKATLANDPALQEKLKSARAKIEARLSSLLKDQPNSLQPDQTVSEALFKNAEGQLNLDYSIENGWLLSFYGNQPDRPRNVSGDYTIAYPMMPQGDSLVSRETNSPSWADAFHHHAVQVTPNIPTVEEDHYSIVSVCEQEIPQDSYFENGSEARKSSSTQDAVTTQKRVPGTLIDLGLWQPLKALKFTFQTLKAMLDILKPPTQNPPQNPADDETDLDQIWGGYLG